ncbi:transcriptional regulator, TetR family [Segniliparus rotundus DSM 44985]|uniref:Transcriptional regulator, TetR family n=1 Tax=Segniliparus rotundus (strain ATCC BAA-972 / CDC 1076 / CIP 108378 / DSM 44985 / JCM 13578) TaxID=640132 RepID=D6Z8Y7_SEGRD|nr:TetR/AcrR family transcriptional regulator [Segniliparus rotundus]ADG98417.1 transcriptional regulator, TetR family [Segniliparus rotundus DSM 44985]
MNEVRRRLLAALEQSVVEHGLLNTTVAEIVRRAATSRRTFYEHFESKEACYLEFLGEINNRLGELITEAVGSTSHPVEQIRQGVRAWLIAAEANSAAHVSLIRELPSLGEPGRQLLRRNHENLIGVFQKLTDNPQLRELGVKPVTRDTARVILGGLNELVISTVEDGGKPTDVEHAAVDAVYALLGPRAELPGLHLAGPHLPDSNATNREDSAWSR